MSLALRSRIALLMFISMTAAISSHADIHQRITAGFELGFALNQFESNPELHSNPKVGLIGGALADFPLIESVYFEISPKFVTKGVSYNTHVNGQSIDVYTFANYLEIPLLMKYKWHDYTNFRPYVVAGPGVGIFLNDGVRLSENNYNQQQLNIAYSSSDLTVQAGGGFETAIAGNARAYFTLRYVYGFTDIATNDRTEWKTRTYEFGSGIVYDF